MSGLLLITAAATEPVTLAEAKAHLNVTTADDDTLITSLIVAAREQIEALTGKALVTQTWELSLDAFPADTQKNDTAAIEITKRPLKTLTSITYLDSAGVSVVLAANKYVIDTRSDPPRLAPAFGETWPATRETLNAVVVKFDAGYGAASAVVQGLKNAILVELATLYLYREDRVGGMVAELATVGRLTAPHLGRRIW